jgi:2-iminobutanoate/2-iminopropanoate deaminase
MLQKIVPEGIMQPFNNAYSHGVLIPPNARVLHLSGQIGARPDGVVPEDGEEQADNVWRNVMAILAAADMTAKNLVKITAYIVDEAVFPFYAAARQRNLGGIEPPASTAVYVPRLVLPEWKIELEAIAASEE